MSSCTAEYTICPFPHSEYSTSHLLYTQVNSSDYFAKILKQGPKLCYGYEIYNLTKSERKQAITYGEAPSRRTVSERERRKASHVDIPIGRNDNPFEKQFSSSTSTHTRKATCVHWIHPVVYLHDSHQEDTFTHTHTAPHTNHPPPPTSQLNTSDPPVQAPTITGPSTQTLVSHDPLLKSP